MYPILLCMLTGVLFLASGYLSVRKKHNVLERMSRMEAAMIDELPEIRSIAERDYQSVIRALQAENIALETDNSAKIEDMTEYYTIWAHQIKTPIASMRLRLENEDTAAARSLRADLFRIEQYAEMALAFIRVGSTAHDYVFRECSLDSLVRQAVKKFSHEFIGRKITLIYNTIDKTVITDEKWFQFVIEQIISNALKYTKEGCIKIYLDASKAPRDVLCIEDTGIGIAAEDLPRIFEKGYTGYNGRTDKRASGIGLYLCRRVCDNLGIAIEASSEVEKGTVVCLDLSRRELMLE